jgi:hypothetical protein
MKYIKIFSLGLLLSVLSISAVYAADFNTLPATGTYGIKSPITVNIKIDTAGETINAAQATIKFDPAILEVKSVSKEGSVFNFWLQEAVFSNTDGTVSFIGGTANGISGTSLQVLQIIFNTKGIGASDISFSDASITAADNTGTNILANTNGAKFTVSTSATVPIAQIPAPVQITRTPVSVPGLPSLPSVNVPLYPNPNSWYNVSSPFSISWKLSPDISGISTALNTNPTFVPPAVSEGLFELKTFPAVSKDGIYYLHVRFQNNNGWGSTLHYRIAVDSQPPIPFKIDLKTGATSDEPSPMFSFATTDALSGIEHYEIFVNSQAAIIASSSTYTLLPQPPGQYAIRVKAIDRAGNGIEDNVKVEILPIETPTINSVNQKIIIGTNDSLDVRGSAIHNASVIVSIEDNSKRLVLQDESKTDTQGLWEFRLDKELRIGDYFVSAKAKDSRGALSLPTSPVKISFVEKPVISLFGWDITFRWLLIILVIVVILGILWFYRKTLLRLARSQRESIIISRDIENAFNAVKEDLDKIIGIVKKDAPANTKEIEINAMSKKIKDTLDNVEKYSSGDIEKLK